MTNLIKKIFARDDVRSSYYDNNEDFGDFSRVKLTEFKTMSGRQAYKLVFKNKDMDYIVIHIWDKENGLEGYSIPCVDKETKKVFFIPA